MKLKRTCKGICKKFRVAKPTGMGRYEAGQGRCQICDVWMDYRGTHLKDGSPATEDSTGWYCNCCNYRMRRHPRNIKYKTKFRSRKSSNYRRDDYIQEHKKVDLSYFNKQRAIMMKKLVTCILSGNGKNILDFLRQSSLNLSDIEEEFDAPLEDLINMAGVFDPPNKMSMILEFERIKAELGTIPTKSEFDERSTLRSSQYETEFQSWEHMLERLGYDPWHDKSVKGKRCISPDYDKIFEEYFENTKISSSYQYALLYALADVGLYETSDLMGSKWIQWHKNKICVDLNFLAIRFIFYYWEIMNSNLRHTIKGMVTNTASGDVNILDHIRNETLQGPPELTTIAHYSMYEFRKKIIAKSIKPEVLRTIMKNLRHPDTSGGIINKSSQNKIEFDKSLADFFKHNLNEFKRDMSVKLKEYLVRINQDTKLKNVDISQDNPFRLFLEDRYMYQDDVKMNSNTVNSLISRSKQLFKNFKNISFREEKKTSSVPKGDGPDETLQDIITDHDTVHKVQDKIKHAPDTYDVIWDRYPTSDLSKSLYVKYVQHIMELDADIEAAMKKNFVALKINRTIIVCIMLQKSKIVLDFKLHVFELDDTLKMLRDISQVGTWTSGKSRIDVSDEDMLQYGIKITKQCYDHAMGNTKISSKNPDAPKKNIMEIRHQAAIKAWETRRKQSGEVAKKPSSLKAAKFTEFQDEITALTEKMIDEHAENKKINRDLKLRLTNEFLESGSMKKVMDDNPSISKEEIKRHVRTNLRFFDVLREMESTGHLHSDPECSFQIALFVVNHYDWDGKSQDEDKVIKTAQAISKCVNSNEHLQNAFSKRKRVSNTASTKNANNVSTAVAIWIAVATLHQQYGKDRQFSNKDILNQVIKQDLLSVGENTIQAYISNHCVANNRRTASVKHRKLYRIEHGRYRLYRKEDYYNRSRSGGPIEPHAWELPEQYKHLLQWYRNEFCSNKD